MARRSAARVAAVTAHDLETGGQAFDIPFPRTRQRLVEVVDVEDQLPLGRAEHAEVRQVSVAAELHPHAGSGGVGQVIGHDHRRAPIERERRHEHSPVADRDQLGHAARALLFQQRDGIRTIRRRLEATVARSWRVTARRQPASRLAPPPSAALGATPTRTTDRASYQTFDCSSLPRTLSARRHPPENNHPRKHNARSGSLMAGGCPEHRSRRAPRHVGRRYLHKSISPAVECARPRRGSRRPRLRTRGVHSPGAATSQPLCRSRRQSQRAPSLPPGSPLDASAAPVLPLTVHSDRCRSVASVRDSGVVGAAPRPRGLWHRAR